MPMISFSGATSKMIDRKLALTIDPITIAQLQGEHVPQSSPGRTSHFAPASNDFTVRTYELCCFTLNASCADSYTIYGSGPSNQTRNATRGDSYTIKESQPGNDTGPTRPLELGD